MIEVVLCDGWRERREALAAATADVVAFPDPDVVMPGDWAERLEAAWAAAPPSVAAIGGPIAARGTAPPWSEATLGLVDYGDEALDLDPLERTLFAGNLSFRRRALVAVGGFGPPPDGRDARDWLSEEHEAQRQLGHWGWLVRYDPALRAERVVEARGALRRRWRYGVRTGIARSRPRGAAMRQAATSAAGALAALARGSRSRVSERLGRAAENAGVVRGWMRRAPAPQPVAASPSRSAPRHRPGVALVLLYHRIAEGEPDPLGLCVSPGNFEMQLDVLGDALEVVTMSDLATRVRDGGSLAGLAAITFDDGYVDNLEVAAPALERAGLPATLFASTAHIAEGRRFFWDEAWRLIAGPGKRPQRLELDGIGAWPTATSGEREAAFRSFHRAVQPRSREEIEAALGAIRDWAGPEAGEPPASARTMTREELRALASSGTFEVGAHTRNHVNLAHQSDDVVRDEVRGSRDDLAAWTGAEPAGFSYPFGLPRHDVSPLARAEVEAAGFAYAVVNQPVAVEPRADIFALPRLFAPDAGADAFRTWMYSKFR